MILDKFKDTVRKYDLFAEGDKILIAFSGGVDSTGLLNLFLELQQEWSLALFLGHFNHKIRPGADRDESYVRKVSEKKSVKLYVGVEDVPAYARANKLNVEEAGRILRYRFLKSIAEQIGNALVATGHTMTDQAETFLMRLFRGSGMRGLSGIHPYRDDKIIRPLLFIEREEIESYLKESGEECCQDESNQDPTFLRNRVRNELIPYLRENFEPNLVQHISQLTSLLREEDALLDGLTQDISRGVYVHKKEGLALDTLSLSRLPRALQRRLVRHFLRKIIQNLRNISYDDVETIIRLSEGKEIHLPSDLILKRERGLILRKGIAALRPSFETWWDGQADITIPELQMTFKGEKRKRSSESPVSYDDSLSACLDWDMLRFPLKIRNRLEGDRYHPLGAPGRKKLKEIMRAKGVVPAERDAHPVFLSEGDIIWVWGLPVSERHKVTESSRRVFVISLKT